MAGWQQAGKVQVSSRPGYAYEQSWSNSVDTFRWFLALAIVIATIGLIAVNILLRPLRLTELQADAICNASYPLQKNIPRTRELRRVVMAMNRMSAKISSIFTEQSVLSEKLHQQANTRIQSPIWVTVVISTANSRRYWDHTKMRPWVHYCYSNYTDCLQSISQPVTSKVTNCCNIPLL